MYAAEYPRELLNQTSVATEVGPLLPKCLYHMLHAKNPIALNLSLFSETFLLLGICNFTLKPQVTTNWRKYLSFGSHSITISYTNW